MVLPMTFILKNELALPYFQEFLVEKNADHTLDFWHCIQNFPKNCDVKLKQAQQRADPDVLMETYARMQEDALRLFYQFVADDAPSKIDLPLQVVSEVHRLATMSPYPPPTTFDSALVSLSGLNFSSALNFFSFLSFSLFVSYFRPPTRPLFMSCFETTTMPSSSRATLIIAACTR